MRSIRKILVLGTMCIIGWTDSVQSKAVFIMDKSNLNYDNQKSAVIGDITFTCPQGKAWHMGECKLKCDENVYPLAGEPDAAIGTAETCESVFGNRFIYTSCHNGWTLADGKCIADACEGFSLSDEPSNIVGAFERCKSGYDYKYKFTSCNEGWNLKNGTCEINTCDSVLFPYNKEPDNSAGIIEKCSSGIMKQYRYTACHSGYTLKSGQCNQNCTLTLKSLPAHCASAENSCIRDGVTYYTSACSACQSGYKLEGTTCQAAAKAHACTSSETRVGDIFFSDNTCASAPISGKTPIGIVYDTGNQLVTALDEIEFYSYDEADDSYYVSDSALSWGGEDHDVPNLINSNKITEMNGYENTKALKADAVQHNAAAYCYNRTIGGKEWYLPATGELHALLSRTAKSTLETVNAQLSLVNGIKIERHNEYWSSTAYNAHSAHAVNVLYPDEQFVTVRHKNKRNGVRCIFTYNSCLLSATANNIPHCNIDSCQRNGKTYYADTCTACEAGFTLTNGKCQANKPTCTLTDTAKPENCESVSNICTRDGIRYYSSVCTTCKVGYLLKDGKCKTCITGYEMKNGTCQKAECSFVDPVEPEHCSRIESCERDGKTYYTCKKCEYPYTEIITGETDDSMVLNVHRCALLTDEDFNW